jgi:YHS domain-containing protein
MKYILAQALLAGLLAGCATESQDFSWVTHTWKTNHGEYALDHISRNKVEIMKAVHRVYLGETYYFESEANAKQFDANPWAYLYCDNTLTTHPDRSDWN